ncbi:MAG: CDP-alcohol phosphatidyltransferase family protein [Prevotella sp.]
MRKNIPNILTSCNLISGCIATCFAFVGGAEMALLWIVIGAGFDFFDGMSARLLGVSSPIGKELDSLADDITFGLAPSMMIFFQLNVMDYPSFLEPFRPILPYAAFIMAAFSALRLAKFNLDERQTLGFIGLPTPANALFWGSLIVGYQPLLDASPMMSVVVLCLVALSSWLLVCEIPMFALKFKHWSINYPGNKLKYIFVAGSAISLAIFHIAALAPIIIAYIGISALSPAPQSQTAGIK